ncbi:hypothetical protein FQN54_000232 [Arachnomyces sp. PD_36]|nr:hypothetical protein FQN54_000232 [Arachnomyces sp. PD_36]
MMGPNPRALLQGLLTLTPLLGVGIQACDSCNGPSSLHKRLVPRMQPESLNATTKPKAPLEWGQINFLQTTDTHGWLEGHLKEENYGADWGDYASFVRHMRAKADDLEVDLLLVDTGDLHDGSGLSDATDLNGEVSNKIYTEIDYDLLAIGNHELYETDIAYETFSNFSKVYGEKYLTSNVEIINKKTGEFETLGNKYRYFTTKHGLRIMAFGVLFDFDGNSEVSKVTKTKDMVQEQWFLDAVHYEEPIDLFVVIGHNPVRRNDSSSTFGTLYDTIREMRPDIPFQGFGGHTHIRDFVVYDSMSTGLESGQYCETLGWLAVTGIQSDSFNGTMEPEGVPNPTRKAVIGGQEVDSHGFSQYADPLYARRYLDWNRLTFAYHAVGSQDLKFDTKDGLRITDEITSWRSALNLSYVYGCAPQTYCMDCEPFDSEGNIYTVLKRALAEVVVNETRADVPRLITLNTGSIRFDLVKGPFTYDDSYIVSPFPNAFQFIPDVPYSQASQVLQILNNGPHQKRAMDVETYTFSSDDEVCADPPYTTTVEKREFLEQQSLARRQVTLSPGHTTVDDFGDDGDDTPHTSIPYHAQPNDFQAQVAFPEDGSDPETVDMVFIDFIGVDYVLPALNEVGGDYTEEDIQYYLPEDFTTNSYIQEYAKIAWQKGMPNCPVGADS